MMRYHKLRKDVASIEKIEITGHTDNHGTDEYNMDLSDRRAATVKDFFMKAGLGDVNILTSGKGESAPIATNTTSEGRQQNRRVQIIIRATQEVPAE